MAAHRQSPIPAIADLLYSVTRPSIRANPLP
jgi:hypothetical protein